MSNTSRGVWRTSHMLTVVSLSGSEEETNRSLGSIGSKLLRRFTNCVVTPQTPKLVSLFSVLILSLIPQNNDSLEFHCFPHKYWKRPMRELYNVLKSIGSKILTRLKNDPTYTVTHAVVAFPVFGRKQLNGLIEEMRLPGTHCWST